MIYVLTGNDFKKKSVFINKISNGIPPIILENEHLCTENIISCAVTMSLFGEKSIFLIDNFSKTGIDLDKKELEEVSNSQNIFIFLEDKLLAINLNKFKKIATVEDFNLKEKIAKNKSDGNFVISDNFAKRNKFGTWLLYKNAVAAGVSPEEISGLLFWKTKMMMLSSTKYFTQKELKVISSSLVMLHHDSHLGKKDFVIGLEQLILNSLEKNK